MSKDESKDEYLITDVPLKALTVFAMPMILGSFFLCTCGCRSMRCSHKCIYLCGTWCRGRCRSACEPLFWCKKL